jgi:hypothetical protein
VAQAAFQDAGAGATAAAAGAALSPACPATVNAGDLLIGHVGIRNITTSPSTPAGWTLLDGPRLSGSGGGVGRHWVFGKIADGTEDGAAIAFGTFGGATANVRCGRIYRFTGNNWTGETLTTIVAGFANVAGTSATIGMAAVTTPVANCLAVACVKQDDNNVIGSSTGETGGDWTEATAEFAASADTGMVIQLQTAGMASAGTITGGGTAAGSDPWGTIGFYIREPVGAPTPVDGPQLDLLWDLRAQADGVQLDLLWDTIAQVAGGQLDLLWDTVAQVSGGQLDLIWDLRTGVDAAQLDLLWDAFAAVDGGQLDLLWDLAAAVDAAPLDLIWDLEVEDLADPVDGPELDLIWDLAAEVDSTQLELLWDVAAPVDGAELDLVWDAVAEVDGDPLGLVWDVEGDAEPVTPSTGGGGYIPATRREVEGEPLRLRWGYIKSPFGTLGAIVGPLAPPEQPPALVRRPLRLPVAEPRPEPSRVEPPAPKPVPQAVDGRALGCSWAVAAEVAAPLGFGWDLAAEVDGARLGLIWRVHFELPPPRRRETPARPELELAALRAEIATLAALLGVEAPTGGDVERLRDDRDALAALVASGN